MKQIIKDVLDDMSNSQVNLGSDAARNMISTLISTALECKGCYTKYGDDEIEEQEVKKGWICQTCGKSTYETDYDYLVHPKLHLGCALEEELKGKDIKEQYHEASSQTVDDAGVNTKSGKYVGGGNIPFGGDTGTDADFDPR